MAASAELGSTHRGKTARTPQGPETKPWGWGEVLLVWGRDDVMGQAC